MKSRRHIVFLGLAWLVYACSSHPPYMGEERDSAPSKVLDWDKIPDAKPKWEPRARYGNHSPYKVFGKTYRVMPSAAGYQETGIGSWYGKKFAGRPTSSMEPYDPYAMTAAHKSLPIPSYVRVTNLANNKSIVVRVNDRGPFHGDRIIDLSYAAAHKIGYANQGIGRVRVEAINLEPSTDTTTKTRHSEESDFKFYLQAGAFRDLSSAETFRQQLAAVTDAPVIIHSPNDISKSVFHRVRIGPFGDESSAYQVRDTIRDSQLADPLLIKH